MYNVYYKVNWWQNHLPRHLLKVKDKQLNTILALALSGALWHWMSNGNTEIPEEVAALPIAKEAYRLSDELRESNFYSVSQSQLARIKKVLDLIQAVWHRDGERFQTYINFTIAILEDVLRFEKNSEAVRAGLNQLLDLMAAMLVQFDPDFDDNEACETAERAFKIWKINKFH